MDRIEFRDEAYESAIKALLFSETGGCTEQNSCYSHNWGEYSGCDRSYESHGWDSDDVEFCSEIEYAISDLLEIYWDRIVAEDVAADTFGYCFVMSANGHGTGFPDYIPNKLGRDLHEMAKGYETISLDHDFESSVWVEM